MKRSLSRCAGMMAAALPALIRDAVGIAGVASLSYGAYECYRPAGFIVGGILLIAVAMLSGRNV